MNDDKSKHDVGFGTNEDNSKHKSDALKRSRSEDLFGGDGGDADYENQQEYNDFPEINSHMLQQINGWLADGWPMISSFLIDIRLTY